MAQSVYDVTFPMKHGGSCHSYATVYQRVATLLENRDDLGVPPFSETYGNLNMVDAVEIPSTFSRLKDFQGCCEVPVLPMPTALWSLASTTRRLATMVMPH